MLQLRTLLQKAFGMPSLNREAVGRVKVWARGALATSADTAIAVNEIACTDPACPGVETVILIMAPGVKTRACKIPKPLEAVSERDVREAVNA
jgi:hypothetical protein